MTPHNPQHWNELSALFDELIELPADACRERMAALATTRPELVDALTRMLAADAAEGLLDRSHIDSQQATIVEPDASETDRSGEQLGSYRLIRLLGRGGMGEVYLTERTGSDFTQQLAIKLLKRGMDSTALLKRFARERQILAQLDHPHIARLLDGGLTGDGVPYFAMDYVDGSSIVDHARRHQLDPRQRVQLMLQAVDAVAHAQSRLVVHRDIKPSNLMVDQQGSVRVLDFGIAKLLGEDEDEREALTGTGVSVMSPAYAAPEQIRGEVVSTATDVHALGGVLFELLTGQSPHPGRSGSPLAWIASLEHETVQRPAEVINRLPADALLGEYGALGRERLSRQVRGDLDTVVAKALQPDPGRRYPTAAAMAADLRAYLDERPISARPDTASYRLRKFVARHRLGVGSASAVLLAIVTGLALALWQAGVAREQAELARSEAGRAERQTAVATEATERAKRVKDFMMQTFVQADPLRQQANAPVTVAEAFDDALARVDTELADDPVLQIDVLDDFSEIRTGQGRFDEAMVLVNRALALAEKTYPPDHPAIAESLVNRGVTANYSGDDRKQAIADLQRAVDILEKHADSAPHDLANALSGLADMREQNGADDASLAMFERVLALWRKDPKPGSEGLAAALHNMSTALLNRGRYAEAEPLSLEALREMTLIGGEDTPRLEPILSTLSMIQYRNGDIAGSNATNERRLAMMEKAFAGPHPWKASVLTDIGQQLSESEPEQAAAKLDAAIEMYEQLSSPRVLMPLRYRALLARNQVGNAEAKRYFDRALAVCTQQSLDHILCDLIRANRAGVIAREGNGTLALSESEAALASIRARGQEGDNEYAQALESKAIALNVLGQHEEALATQSQAIERYVVMFGENHEEVARARANLAKLR